VGGLCVVKEKDKPGGRLVPVELLVDKREVALVAVPDGRVGQLKQVVSTFTLCTSPSDHVARRFSTLTAKCDGFYC